ncbi:hypothetical protein [Shewanella litorisediminis]|uniref:Neuromedin U n=1 Tax=Shewanella litorisediminis TaxID=1173586 RepID=A0ABX7FYP7_9GAMM|nr:hypothetical protein [Shewanella litorisediminis]MCL2919239.1 hypothetical protein [Shewanella litorisediminis]QRH00166.1 hypothetical protein JQC75_09590 [Shewanella litorisediminis]
MKHYTKGLVLAASLGVINFAVADTDDVDKIARELANPNTTLGSLSFNFDYITYEGDLPNADDQGNFQVSFQPILPIPISAGTNLYIRPNFQFISDRPIYDAGSNDFRDADFGMGDIGFDVALGHSFSNGIVLAGGIVGTMDTATEKELGNDQWLLGPELAVGYVQKWGVVGLLVTHQWDIGGANDKDTSITGGQYFYTFNLGQGWQISASPSWSYNNEADSGNKFTLPLGIGVAKTTKLGNTPIKFGFQYWNYIQNADPFGPEQQFRFTVTPVVPLPW